MIEQVISGGQTGADQAGWRAARSLGIPTGGWMPKGFLTEDGPRPEFADLYGAKEHWTSDYSTRTRLNVRLSDATIIFVTESEALSRGAALTRKESEMAGIPSLFVRHGPHEDFGEVAQWLMDRRSRILNVAGTRESKSPGIGAWVELSLCCVFNSLKREIPRS